MLGSMEQLAGAAAGDPDPSRLDAEALAATDRIGTDPAAAFDAIAQQALAVWHTPGVLERTCAMPMGPRSALVVARISVSDAVVHGWTFPAPSARTPASRPSLPNRCWR